MTTPDPRSEHSPGPRPDVSGARADGGGRQAAPGSAASPRAPRSKRGGAGRSLGLGLAAALLIFVTVVLVLFVMFNTQTVDISLVFGNVQAPLVLALVIAAVLGGLVVAMAAAVLRARHKDR